FGLSGEPNRFGREADAQAAAGGPPETIQSAPADYASADLGGGLAEDHGVDPSQDDPLAPPIDPMWSGQAARPPPVSSSASAEPDPQAIARSAPILFSAASGAGERDDGDRLPSRLAPPR